MTLFLNDFQTFRLRWNRSSYLKLIFGLLYGFFKEGFGGS